MIVAHALGGVAEVELTIEWHRFCLTVQYGFIAACRLCVSEQEVNYRSPNPGVLLRCSDSYVFDEAYNATAVEKFVHKVKSAGADDAALVLGNSDDHVRIPSKPLEDGRGVGRIAVTGGAQRVEGCEESVFNIFEAQLANAKISHL